MCNDCIERVIAHWRHEPEKVARLLENMANNNYDPLLAVQAAERLREFGDPRENNPAHQVLMENPDAPINPSYAYQKFHEATCSLDSKDVLEERLAKAFGNLSTLREDDFPNEDRLRERFSRLMTSLEILAVPREVPLTIDEIAILSKTRDQAENLAEEVLSIFANLARRGAKAEKLE